MTEFRRNSEFDRVFWDDYSGQKWMTSQTATREAGQSSSSSQALTPNRPKGLGLNNSYSDSVSTLFLYPFSEGFASTTKSTYTLENSASSETPTDRDKRFHIKRSEYSEYNEQRIKFHLKFYISQMSVFTVHRYKHQFMQACFTFLHCPQSPSGRSNIFPVRFAGF